MVCSYFKGPEIVQLFGPNYSVPNALSMKIVSKDIEFEGERKNGCAIWNHKLYENNNYIGTVLDFTANNKTIMFRDMKFSRELNWDIIPDNLSYISKLPNIFDISNDCYIGEIKEGSAFYTYCTYDDVKRGFITNRPYYYAVLSLGDIKLNSLDNKKINCSAKEGVLAFIFANTFDELIDLINQVKVIGVETYYNETILYWEKFTFKRKANQSINNEEYEKAADDIAILIKTQQSIKGGVLAGHNYHLAYIRDNYGVLRGMLSLGCYDEVKLMLLYYIEIFNKYGKIHNAQGTDLFAFHIHENDNVEITGYMVLMVVDYYTKTKDQDTLEIMRPLIMWCIKRQHSYLKKGMLPFNGDETYIAGGILPRTAINHGSMEATLLYHKACVALLLLQNVLSLDTELLEIIENDSKDIEAIFKSNFIVDGNLACNNPNYQNENEEPKSRYGVRFCGHGMGVTFKNEDGAYLCIDCLEKEFPQFKQEKDKIYYINSVILMPIFINSTLIERYIIDREIDKMFERFVVDGKMPSGLSSNIMVGYDLGLLIYAIKDKNDTIKNELIKKMLALRDNTGAFVEYYVDNKPAGTMCRPWESALNIMALIEQG